MISVTIGDKDFQAEWDVKVKSVRNPKVMMKAAGRELGNQLKKHFRQKDVDEPNKLAPGRREHFWLQVGQSVQEAVLSADGLAVSVTIADPRFAQKLFGGRIVAKNADALTIPVAPEAYGRTARTFEEETGLQLFLIKTGKGNFERAVLAAHEQPGAGFTVEYLLTPSVDQEADATALPDIGILQAAVLARGDAVLKRQIQSGQAEISYDI